MSDWSHITNNHQLTKLVLFAGLKQKEVYLSRLSQEWDSERRDMSCFQGAIKNTSDLTAFNWNEAVGEMANVVPMTHEVLATLMPVNVTVKQHGLKGPRTDRRFLSDEESTNKIEARIGMITTILLYSINPWVYNRVPSIMGIHLWLDGASQRTFQSLNRFCVSQSNDAVRNHIDTIRLDFDADVLGWKKEAEDMELIDTPNTVVPTSGFSMGFDNVQFSVNPNYQSTQKTSMFHMMALCYAVKNRVSYPLQLTNHTTPAEHLPATTLIPSNEDYDQLKTYLHFIITTVVQKHFTNIPPSSAKPPDHKYTTNMTERSNISNLGVVKGNPSKTPDTMHILSTLTKYIPVHSARPCTMPIHGDGGTVESVAKAKKARSLSTSKLDSFTCFAELAQDFHKEGILLQDLMDDMYSSDSMSNPGNLYNVKMVFGHFAAQPPVMSNFKDVWNLVSFATEGLTVLLFLKMAKLSGLDELPNIDLTSSSGDAWMKAVVDEVVDRIFVRPSPEDLRVVAEGYADNRKTQSLGGEDVFPFCYCHEDVHSDMVQCCNVKCPHGWIHYSCVQPTPMTMAPEDDWYCSEECTSASGYIYCHCKQMKGGRMVQCFMKENCARHECF